MSKPAPASRRQRDSDIATIIAALRDAHTQLRGRPRPEILAAIDRIVALWLAPRSPWRERAEETLPQATGFSAAMIRHGLPILIEPLRAVSVRELLDREQVADSRVGPAVIVHIMSGNIPALSATSMILSLAIGSSALVKAARGDRVFPELFAASIAEVDAELGASVAASYWPGGKHSIEDTVFREADLVVAFGSNASIAAMRERCSARFIGHGHRVSFALLTREMSTAPLVTAALAEDVALWDQRGCLSPQVCFVEGDFECACATAESLSQALDAVTLRLPPGRFDAVEHTAIRRFRDDAEWRALAGRPVRLLTPSTGLAWTIVVEGEPIFRPTPLGRSLRILPLARIETLGEILAPARGVLEAAGVAASIERRAEIEPILRAAGVQWITDIGQMQHPPLAWTQGGRPRIADWIGEES